MTAEPQATTTASPADVSIKELEGRWGLSRNGLKARARALGVELQRVSSTLTVWPGDFLELGERLHEHLAQGQPMGTFPGLRPVPLSGGGAVSGLPVPSVTTAGAACTPEGALARARALAAAADEDLPLTGEELAAVLGLPPEAVDELRSGAVVRGFRLRRGGGRGPGGYWRVERCWRASTVPALTAGGAGGDYTATPVRALPAAAAARRVGFIEASFEVLAPGPTLFPVPRSGGLGGDRF